MAGCGRLGKVLERGGFTYNKLLSRAKLPTLYNRRLQDIAVLMHKVKNNQALLYIKNLNLKNSVMNYVIRIFSYPGLKV